MKHPKLIALVLLFTLFLTAFSGCKPKEPLLKVHTVMKEFDIEGFDIESILNRTDLMIVDDCSIVPPYAPDLPPYKEFYSEEENITCYMVGKTGEMFSYIYVFDSIETAHLAYEVGVKYGAFHYFEFHSIVRINNYVWVSAVSHNSPEKFKHSFVEFLKEIGITDLGEAQEYKSSQTIKQIDTAASETSVIEALKSHGYTTVYTYSSGYMYLENVQFTTLLNAEGDKRLILLSCDGLQSAEDFLKSINVYAYSGTTVTNIIYSISYESRHMALIGIQYDLEDIWNEIT